MCLDCGMWLSHQCEMPRLPWAATVKQEATSHHDCAETEGIVGKGVQSEQHRPEALLSRQQGKTCVHWELRSMREFYGLCQLADPRGVVISTSVKSSGFRVCTAWTHTHCRVIVRLNWMMIWSSWTSFPYRAETQSCLGGNFCCNYT